MSFLLIVYPFYLLIWFVFANELFMYLFMYGPCYLQHRTSTVQSIMYVLIKRVTALLLFYILYSNKVGGHLKVFFKHDTVLCCRNQNVKEVNKTRTRLSRLICIQPPWLRPFMQITRDVGGSQRYVSPSDISLKAYLKPWLQFQSQWTTYATKAAAELGDCPSAQRAQTRRQRLTRRGERGSGSIPGEANETFCRRC